MPPALPPPRLDLASHAMAICSYQMHSAECDPTQGTKELQSTVLSTAFSHPTASQKDSITPESSHGQRVIQKGQATAYLN